MGIVKERNITRVFYLSVTKSSYRAEVFQHHLTHVVTNRRTASANTTNLSEFNV